MRWFSGGRAVVVLLVLLAALVAPATRLARAHGGGVARVAVAGAAAATQATVEQGRKARAQALLDEGLRLTEERDFAAALDRFEAAHAVYPSEKLLLNIGTCLRHLGRHAEAADVYERYLQEPRADPRRAAELERILGEIDATVGWLTVEAADPLARVRVDDRWLSDFAGRATVRVDPGEHTVIVQRPSEAPLVRIVEVRARERKRVALPDEADSSAPGSDQRLAAYGLFAVGAIAVGVGATFGVLALVSEAELADDPAPELQAAADRDATVAIAGLAVGGAALAAGLIVYLTAPEDEAEATVSGGALPGGASGVHLRVAW